MHSNPWSNKGFWQLGVASLISFSIYLVASAIYYRIGFPLDDSWIHLTYARNLVQYGEWAFQPGSPSAGSTAPLWTGLLSIGFVLNLAPYVWTYFMGVLLLWAMGLLSESLVRKIAPSYNPRFPWVGLFFITEWHLVWAAASGMETLLHAFLVTMILGLLMSGSRRFMALGLLTGLSVWVRPDGLTLLGPVAVHVLAGLRADGKRWRGLGVFTLGFASLLVPYLLFNLILSGTPMPNTFYAKQAEYVAWQATPLLTRFGQLLLQLLVGPGLALLPGALGWLYVSVRRRDFSTLACMVWFAGYLSIYIQRLPVYQHGRYIMPAMPIFFLWGLIALVEFSRRKDRVINHWLVVTSWKYLVGSLSGVFIVVGAYAYAQDVAIIESEMVVTARWVASNVPAGEVIAAHDIGALGYFDHHELIDLAGLVSPEVIPFIRDEAELARYLTEKEVSILIAFPEFYPDLTDRAELVFTSAGPISPRFGNANMAVYRWR